MFVTVADELHFGRAADRLHMAQPPLSQQIRALEKELGLTLFVRNSRNVRLTADGEMLLAGARKVLRESAALEATALDLRTGTLSEFRLGFVSSAAITLVPSLTQALRRETPRLHLELQERTTGQQLEMLADGKLDAGIVRELAPDDPALVAHVFREPLVVAVPSTHRLSHRADVALSALRGERFVAFPRSRISRLYDRIDSLLTEAGVVFQVDQEAVEFLTILGLVASDVGIAVVPRAMSALRMPGVRMLPIRSDHAYSEVSFVVAPGRILLLPRLQQALTGLFADSGGDEP